MERALISLGRAELTDMIEQDHGAEISCRFCDKVYQFDEKELTQLLESATVKHDEA